MRPHRLRLQAFGPFAGAVEVDLDALAGSGLFLLHGPTGAGKTTLLDGLGFALYGRVPGVRGKTGRLRSDHADPGVRTEVVDPLTDHIDEWGWQALQPHQDAMIAKAEGLVDRLAARLSARTGR